MLFFTSKEIHNACISGCIIIIQWMPHNVKISIHNVRVSVVSARYRWSGWLSVYRQNISTQNVESPKMNNNNVIMHKTQVVQDTAIDSCPFCPILNLNECHFSLSLVIVLTYLHKGSSTFKDFSQMWKASHFVKFPLGHPIVYHFMRFWIKYSSSPSSRL